MFKFFCFTVTANLLEMKNWTSIGCMFANINSPYRDFHLFAPYLDQALVSSTGITSGYATDDRAVQLQRERKKEKYESSDQIPSPEQLFRGT